jgi:electron transport complex protein RnfB
MRNISPEEIDAILPQTQCGLCGHGGCMPYAEALIFESAEINLCPPGGIPVLRKLGELLEKDPTPFENGMHEKTKPTLIAVIREDECIGCTKCIQACPVDAILGSSKSMHAVISDECTGCELCVPACPVDCIDMNVNETQNIKDKADSFRQRFQAREKRLVQEKQQQLAKKLAHTTKEKKDYIQAALERARLKKNTY